MTTSVRQQGKTTSVRQQVVTAIACCCTLVVFLALPAVAALGYLDLAEIAVGAYDDATGIGRIHRRGAPPAICLSTPCAEKPNYFIGAEKNPGPLAYDNFAVGPGRGCGAVAIFADGEWKTIPNWESARVLHEGDDCLEFELVYPAVCALGEMTYRIAMKKDENFFRNDVSFEFPERLAKGWIVRPEIREDPTCAAKPFLRFGGDGTKANFSCEAGYAISNKEASK